MLYSKHEACHHADFCIAKLCEESAKKEQKTNDYGKEKDE